MKIRIKYRDGSWWAYFNGEEMSGFHGESLVALCGAINFIWPASKAIKGCGSDTGKWVSEQAKQERQIQAKRASEKLAKWKGM